ncbi:hypothetical protein GCM10022281_08760 [Sphingomonas rosea]|uniref:DNA-directed DNA polymerase n=1 Tax=Sphingomonas rosea TaxID=335605 RepID=A0ABP7TUG3_9SPHN
MKLAAGRVAATLDRPDPSVRFYLFSGSDSSTSRLHAQRLLGALKAEKVATSVAQLKSDPAWLADEAASISMFGGQRLLWIEPAGEDILPAVTALLDLPSAEAPAIAIIASTLRKDSKIAKFADSRPGAIHVASEPLAARDLVAAILELGRGEGLRLTPQLAERVAEEAAGDLMLARLELQKFALYADAAPDRPCDLDESVVDALGIDQAETDHSRPGDLALAGDLHQLGAELVLLEASAIDAIPVVRALQRRLLMLVPLRARVDSGQSIGTVLGSVWRDKAAVTRILPRWTSARLAEVMVRVQKLERELMLRPVPPSAALGELLMQLARAAGR